MRLSALLAVVFAAGLVASLALASPAKNPKNNTASQTTTTTTEPKKPKCEHAELKGSATSGSVAFTVTKANKRGRNLVGTAVILSVPAGASIKAKVCTSAGGLTLRDLHVKVRPPKSPKP